MSNVFFLITSGYVSSLYTFQGKTTQTFEFQSVFGPNMTQARLFGEVQELILVRFPRKCVQLFKLETFSSRALTDIMCQL